jgi:thiol-disulfide isomerase/thioredoxin
MNKKISIELLIFILLLSLTFKAFSQNETEIHFKARGKVDMADNNEIKFEFFNNSGELIKYTSKVKRKQFEIKGSLEDSSAIMVKLYGNVESRDDGDPNSINYFMEPGVLSIKLKEGNFKNAIIKGSESEKIYNKYLKLLANEKVNKKVDSLQSLNSRLNFIRTYPNSSVSALVVLYEMRTGKSLEYIKCLFNELGAFARKSRDGTTIANKINSIERYSLGKKLNSFNGIDTSGNKIEILNFNADITILDFWATWCKPCIENFLVLKELQHTHSDKRITVITSSSDFNYDKWKAALYKYKIEHWINLYDIREQNEKIKISKTEMAEYFGVSSLPTTILINKHGQVIGRFGGFGGSPIENMYQKILDVLMRQDL